MYSIYTPCPKGTGLAIATANGFAPITTLSEFTPADRTVEQVNRKAKAIQDRLDRETLALEERDLETVMTGSESQTEPAYHWPLPCPVQPFKRIPETATEREARHWINNRMAVKVAARRRGRRIIKVYSQAA